MSKITDMTTAEIQAALEIAHNHEGFTQLGESATAEKHSDITGVTGALGTETSYATGLSKAKIISYTVNVSDSDGTLILPNSGVSGTDNNNYSAYIRDDGLLYIYIPTASTAVYGCAFTCLIVYKE